MEFNLIFFFEDEYILSFGGVMDIFKCTYAQFLFLLRTLGFSLYMLLIQLNVAMERNKFKTSWLTKYLALHKIWNFLAINKTLCNLEMDGPVRFGSGRHIFLGIWNILLNKFSNPCITKCVDMCKCIKTDTINLICSKAIFYTKSRLVSCD